MPSATSSENNSKLPPDAIASEVPNAWPRVLPKVIGNHLQLGNPDEHCEFRLHLAYSGLMSISMAADGGILGLYWKKDPDGFSYSDFAAGISRFPLPWLLMGSTAGTFLLSDRTTFLVGNNGIAITNGKGEIEFIKAAEIHGMAYRPDAKPDQGGTQQS